jgi:1,4-alpha-glucan branching enzyme
MNRKKILVVSAFFFPHIGGVEVYTQRLFSRLKAKYPETEVAILSLNTEKALEYEVMDGISIYRLPCFGFPSMNPLFSIRELGRLLRDIDIDSFDVIITQCRYYFLTNIMGSMARRRKIPLVHIEHNAGYMQHGNYFVQWAARVYDVCFSPFVLRRPKTLLCVSEGVRTFLLNTFRVDEKRLLVRESGIDTSEWKERVYTPSENRFPVLIYVGRLIESKGIFLLLEALRNLKTGYPRLSLLVAGSGPDEERVKDCVREYGLQDQVSILGSVDHDVLRRLYQSVDIFVNPSYYSEGLQITLLEAACSGLPIVTTDVSGARELFHHEESAIVVKQKSVTALERGILRLTTDPLLRQKIGALARTRSSEAFAWEHKLDAFYEAIFR